MKPKYLQLWGAEYEYCCMKIILSCVQKADTWEFIRAIEKLAWRLNSVETF
jgi:hypothetical protein